MHKRRISGALTALAVLCVAGRGAVEEPLGDWLSPAWGMGGVPLPAGLRVSDVQPWATIFTVSAFGQSGRAGTVVVSDAAQWPERTGASAPLLIVAENVIDQNGDGLVDAPLPDPSGGTVVFDFPGDTDVVFARLFDVDEGGTRVRAYRGRELVADDDVPPGEGEIIVEISAGGFDITRLEFELGGTCGIAGLSMRPCSSVLDFDHSVTGVPIQIAAGETYAGQYAGIGLFSGYVMAQNAAPGHPDMAIVYDTSVNGADPDLVTPGPGIGNDEPLGHVMIIAENAQDLDGDFAVDVPDDEEHGGVIQFGWATNSVVFRSLKVIDIDVGEISWVRIHDDLGTFLDLPLQQLGDNSVQTITLAPGESPWTRFIEVHLGGSGAVAELQVCTVN